MLLDENFMGQYNVVNTTYNERNVVKIFILGG